MIVCNLDLWLIEIKFFSKKNFRVLLNKHVDRIVEVKTKTIHVNKTQQIWSIDKYNVKCDYINENV
jgi:hypothetical protein